MAERVINTTAIPVQVFMSGSLCGGRATPLPVAHHGRTTSFIQPAELDGRGAPPSRQRALERNTSRFSSACTAVRPLPAFADQRIARFPPRLRRYPIRVRRRRGTRTSVIRCTGIMRCQCTLYFPSCARAARRLTAPRTTSPTLHFIAGSSLKCRYGRSRAITAPSPHIRGKRSQHATMRPGM